MPSSFVSGPGSSSTRAGIAEVLALLTGHGPHADAPGAKPAAEALVQRGVSGPGVDGPGTHQRLDADAPPLDTLTTPNGSEATR